MKRLRSAGAALLGLSISVGACGGGSGARMPTKSGAMGSTFAGKHKCQADAHDRPFIVEWDATDIATFESRAARDMVFVRYEGCDLRVIDGCSDESVPGRYGSYAPPRWTSGGVEKISIADEGELYAKLPLGVATFGGEVQRGVTLDLEYYVSGVAMATRGTMFRGALKDNPACAEATHFVKAYNLGAFEIHASESARDAAGASAAGVGAGVESRRSEKTQKRAGVLSACTGTTAADSEKCKVPIRLALVPIQEGEGPVREDKGGPAHPEIDLNQTPMVQAGKLRNAAAEKAELKDGAACLADLDEADKIDPDPTRVSTNPKALLWLRASCLMLTGDCKSGKEMLRKARQAQSPQLSAEIVDGMVNTTARGLCPVDQLSTWDRIERLSGDMYFAWSKKEPDNCARIAKQLLGELDKAGKPPSWEQESTLKGAWTMVGNAGECLARAGRCAEGKKLAQESIRRRGQAAALKEPAYTERWEKAYPTCKGK